MPGNRVQALTTACPLPPFVCPSGHRVPSERRGTTRHPLLGTWRHRGSAAHGGALAGSSQGHHR